jgi:hypothetical protein
MSGSGVPDHLSVVRVPQGVHFVREWGGADALSVFLPGGAPELFHRAVML